MGEPKPIQDKDVFKSRISVAMCRVLAGLILIAGIILIVASFVDGKNPAAVTFLVGGVSCLVISGWWFLIANHSDDVHMLS